MQITIRKGLDVALAGRPTQALEAGTKRVSSVALLGQDYPGLHPEVRVAVGERVRLGQALAHDRERPQLLLTAPGAGVVRAIQIGPGRSVQSIVVALEGDDEETFAARRRAELGRLERGAVVEELLASGAWACLRARPFGHVPAPEDSPRALFVTATANDALAPDPACVLAGREQDLEDGLSVLTHLTDGPLFLCKRAGAAIPAQAGARVRVVEFEGSHAAGLVGTHIHHLDPLARGRSVWCVGYADVVAIGRLFTSGRISVERIVSLAGPGVVRPRLVRARVGADVASLVEGELGSGPFRIVSGSAFSGRQATAWGRHLGRLHLQVTVLSEPDLGATRRRGLFARPAPSRTTALGGSPGPFVPLGAFERALPLDMLPVPLLRALLVGDDAAAEALGCLELEEEDLALCTFVCPGKLEYGAYLRASLERLQEVE